MKSVEEALALVRGIVRSIRYDATKPRQRDWMHAGGFSWVIGAEQPGVRDYVPKRPWTVDETKLPELLDAARSDPYAHEAAETLAKMHLRECKPLPEPLAAFVLDWMDNPPKRKKTESPEIRARDEMVSTLVGILHRDAGVPPTRNETAKHRQSGCDLVVQVYQECGKSLTYSAAASAWKRYGKP